MKREIKFRCWDEKAVMNGGSSYMVYFDGEPFLDSMDGELRIRSNVNFSANDLSPLMQFTGLKDKNGKDIYHHDIIDTESGRFTVVWDADAAAFRYHDTQGNSESPLNYDHLEVIGNVYENPELLK
jgi:hypothetical protein